MGLPGGEKSEEFFADVSTSPEQRQAARLVIAERAGHDCADLLDMLGLAS